jgi:hypothetical protein
MKKIFSYPGFTLIIISISFMMTGFMINIVAGIKQPIKFNHKKHVEQVELECSHCHKYYKTQRTSGRPDMDICMECHEQALTDNPEEEKIRTFASEKNEIPWKRIYYIPDHVAFSHQVHTQYAQINCEVCHGKIAELEKPPEAPLVSLTMDFCMDCHRKSKATLDCLPCHK